MIGYSDGGGFAVGIGPQGVEKGLVGRFQQGPTTHVVPLKNVDTDADLSQENDKGVERTEEIENKASDV